VDTTYSIDIIISRGERGGGGGGRPPPTKT